MQLAGFFSHEQERGPGKAGPASRDRREQRLRALRAETTNGSPFVKADGCWWGLKDRADVRDLKDS